MNQRVVVWSLDVKKLNMNGKKGTIVGINKLYIKCLSQLLNTQGVYRSFLSSGYMSDDEQTSDIL